MNKSILINLMLLIIQVLKKNIYINIKFTCNSTIIKL